MFKPWKSEILVPVAGLLVLGGLARWLVSTESPAPARGPASAAEATLVGDPRDPGPNLPPVGRSLFDSLVTVEKPRSKREYQIPFPFPQLINKLNTDSSAGMRGVLIPLGRSLQRNAASPDFFKYPRVVTFADSPLHRGKLFIGYQEKAKVLEVVSYNERAGRFEYQIVHDYGPGLVPKVSYANRQVCLSCHQGQTPIFSKMLWQETNANPAVAARLASDLGGVTSYQGFPIQIGTGVPQDFQARVDEVNLIPAYQKIWMEGCTHSFGTDNGASCRAAIVASIFRYRMGSDRDDFMQSRAYREVYLPTVRGAWQEKWPNGLAIADPDLPNRNPFEKRTGPGFAVQSLDASDPVKTLLGDLVKKSDVPSNLEPLNPRPPIAVWSHAVEADLSRVVVGLAGFFSPKDIQQIDDRLGEIGASGKLAKPQSSVTSCSVQPIEAGAGGAPRYELDCGENGPISFTGIIKVGPDRSVTGNLSGMSFASSHDGTAAAKVSGRFVRQDLITLVPRHASTGYSLRKSDGARVSQIEIDLGERDRAEVRITFQDDLVVLEQALRDMDPLGAAPFQRNLILRGLFKALGIPSDRIEGALPEDADMPEPQADAVTGSGSPFFVDLKQSPDPGLSAFGRRCARCHDNFEGFPSAYLTGTLEEVVKQIDHCSERIAYRLAMWDFDISARKKSPMPPPHSLDMSVEEWAKSNDLKALRAFVAKNLARRRQSVQSVLKQDFVSLPGCMP